MYIHGVEDTSFLREDRVHMYSRISVYIRLLREKPHRLQLLRDMIIRHDSGHTRLIMQRLILPEEST